MPSLLLFLAMLLPAFYSIAQTTVRITAVPAATPADASWFLAGSLNGRPPASPAHALIRQPNGSYGLILPASLSRAVEFKCTPGSRATVEPNVVGQEVANHRHTPGNAAATLTLSADGWKDLSGGPQTPCQSTALQPNVRVISEAFALPQLGRARRIWVYLPNDYATAPAKRYPVLYLHDGQNVFDACTSFSGEWGVDETLSRLQQQGLDAAGSIVVAVDNGGSERLNELSPWKNAQYGGGQGDQYVDFLVQTLKPYIDANYRTLTGREFTGIAGSSLGGLISTYAALKYPLVYGRVGVFSPAYWSAGPPLFTYLRQHPPRPDTRFYFVAGATESATMAPLMRAVHDSLAQAGVPAANLSYRVAPDGQHAEWFWKREFAAAYPWLIQPAGTTSTGKPKAGLAFSAYFNPTQNRLTLLLPAEVRGSARLQIVDAQGRTVRRQKLKSGAVVEVSELAAGLYQLHVTAGALQGRQALVRQ